MRFDGLETNIQKIKRYSVKTEQYSRPDCVTVTGMTKSNAETTTELGPKIAFALRKSGVVV